MLVSVLASSLRINIVSLHAVQTSCSVLVVLCTILVFCFAEEVAGEGIACLARGAVTLVVIAGAMGNGARFLFGQGEGVFALIAAIVVESEASIDDAPVRLMSEGSVAADAGVVVVVLAPWALLHAAVQFLGVVVAVHALDAGSVFIHLLAELVFGDAGAVRLEHIVRIALQALSILGDQTVGHFAGVVQQVVP